MTETEWGVIWDVDGTLVDTAELHFQAWQELAGQLRQPFTRDDFRATFGRRNPEILRQLFGTHWTDTEIDELGFAKEELYRASAQRGVALLPGVRPLLQAIHTHGWKQAIGSSAPRQNLELIVRLLEVGAYFQAVVAMEDTQRGKPDPEVFLIAAQRLGIAPQHCLVFEDAVAGVEAAKAGGMRCIAVSFVGHHSPEKLAAAGADLVVRTLAEVDTATIAALLR